MIELLNIKTVVHGLAAGIAAGLYSIRLYRKMPACWVCDSGEDPRAEHMPALRIHLKGEHNTAILICITAVFLIFLKDQRCAFCTPTATAGSILALTALAAAAQADSAYFILPDQVALFVLVAGLLCGFSFDLAALPSQELHGLLFPESAERRISNPADIKAKPPLSLSMLAHTADAASGALWGFLIMLLCALLSLLISGRQGIGMGDIKLIGACGALVGQHGILFLILFSSLGVGLSAWKDLKNRPSAAAAQKPAGLWIFAAATLCLFFR